jgi:hypothetical protein
MAHTRRLNYRTDKSYQQTILTAYRRNFHYLFEFSDILPIFAKQLFIGTHLSQPCRWCSMVGLYYRISFIPIIYRPASSFLVVWGIFCLLNRTKFLAICKSLLSPENPRIPI